MGKVLKLLERLYCREKVGKVSKFQERLFNDNFKAGNGEERKGKGKLSVPPKENILFFYEQCTKQLDNTNLPTNVWWVLAKNSSIQKLSILNT